MNIFVFEIRGNMQETAGALISSFLSSTTALRMSNTNQPIFVLVFEKISQDFIYRGGGVTERSKDAAAHIASRFASTTVYHYDMYKVRAFKLLVLFIPSSHPSRLFSIDAEIPPPVEDS